MLGILLLGCPSPTTPPTGSTGSDGLCADRSGGALVDLAINAETFRLWSTDDAFVDQAEALLVSGATQVPTFQELALGADCDDQWSWHVGPAAMSWSDFTIELCDALPSYVESDPAGWIGSVGSWCPWAAVVTAVDDRR